MKMFNNKPFIAHTSHSCLSPDCSPAFTVLMAGHHRRRIDEVQVTTQRNYQMLLLKPTQRLQLKLKWWWWWRLTTAMKAMLMVNIIIEDWKQWQQQKKMKKEKNYIVKWMNANHGQSSCPSVRRRWFDCCCRCKKSTINITKNNTNNTNDGGIKKYNLMKKDVSSNWV